jgi:hypothetical protein
MRRRTREPRPAGWAVHSAFVPRRDGPRRLEQAFQVLLGTDPGSCGMPPTTAEGGTDHESRRICQGLDREAGA